jgi:predicted metalloprotease
MKWEGRRESADVQDRRRIGLPMVGGGLGVVVVALIVFLLGWAHHTQKVKQVLETGDLEEALQAASAIGDDNIQRQSQGYVVPDSFTHGTSQQRVRWFRRGFETGDLNQGDTFRVSESQL